MPVVHEIEPAELTGVFDRPGRRRRRLVPRIRRRRWMLIGVGALIVAVVIAGVATVRHLDHQYGPPAAGPFSGLASARAFASSDGGAGSLRLLTTAATGEVVASLADWGRHSVRITSIDSDAVVSRVQWARVGGTRLTGGSGSNPWRPFPATIPAGGMIELLVTIRRPAICRHHPTPVGSISWDGDAAVHWKSLLRSHKTETQIVDRDPHGIVLC